MKKIIKLLLLIVTLIACKNDPKPEKVEEQEEKSNKMPPPQDGGKGAEIMNTVIDSAGGQQYETATIEFKFRDAVYKSTRNCGMFEISRKKQDSSGNETLGTVNNIGFTYYKNGEEEILADTTANNYKNSINSVHYFVQLPFGLNDPAVRKELVAEDSIQGKAYYEIQVNFAQEDGGEDFEDTYMYWVNKDSYTVDYLAYSYHVNGGGMRFREAINPRVLEGIRFVDYKNYAPQENASPALQDLDDLFENNELELFSTIENKDLKVEVLKDKNIDLVFSTNYQRTLETARPTAEEAEVKIELYKANHLYSKDFQQKTNGKRVFIVGHQDTTPQFVNKILGENKYRRIADDENSELYTVTIYPDGKKTSQVKKFPLPEEDNQE